MAPVNDVIFYTVKVSALVRRTEMGGHEWRPETADPKSPMAYTPQVEKTVEREIDLLEQRLDTLDMRALVAVLNNLPVPMSVGEIK